MKNLLTLFAIFLITGIANAQNTKPTLEETVNFIVRTLNNSYNAMGPVSEFAINENGLNYRVTTKYWDYKYNYLGVFFDNIRNVTIDKSYVFGNDNIPIDLTFTSKSISLHTTGSNQLKKNVDERTNDIDNITLAVPRDKAPSIVKAFERLKEIYQQENKDPFK